MRLVNIGIDNFFLRSTIWDGGYFFTAGEKCRINGNLLQTCNEDEVVYTLTSALPVVSQLVQDFKLSPTGYSGSPSNGVIFDFDDDLSIADEHYFTGNKFTALIDNKNGVMRISKTANYPITTGTLVFTSLVNSDASSILESLPLYMLSSYSLENLRRKVRVMAVGMLPDADNNPTYSALLYVPDERNLGYSDGIGIYSARTHKSVKNPAYKGVDLNVLLGV